MKKVEIVFYIVCISKLLYLSSIVVLLLVVSEWRESLMKCEKYAFYLFILDQFLLVHSLNS